MARTAAAERLARSTEADLVDARRLRDDLVVAAQALTLAAGHDPDIARCRDAGCRLVDTDTTGGLCTVAHRVGGLDDVPGSPAPGQVLDVPRALHLFADDPETEAIVLIGEIGGSAEEMAAAWAGEHLRDVPKAAFIAGRTAPEGKRMGHAGAIISGGAGTAASKVEALEAAGVQGVSLDFTLPDLVATLAAGPLPLDAALVGRVRDRLDAKDAGGVAELALAYLPLIEAAGPFDAAHDRLCALDAQGALTSRLDGLWRIAESVRGRVALAAGRLDEARAELRAALDLEASGANRLNLALALLALQRPAEAIPLLEAAAGDAAYGARARALLGEARRQAGRVR